MTILETILFYVFFSFIVIIFGLPRIALRGHPKVTSEEMARSRPALKGIEFKYPLPLFICPPVLAILLIAAGSPLGRPTYNEIFLFFPSLLFLGFYDGLFTLLTGVIPMTSRWHWNRFIDDEHKKYRWMAQLQIGLAILATLACLAVFYFYPG